MSVIWPSCSGKGRTVCDCSVCKDLEEEIPLVYDTDDNWNYGHAVCCFKRRLNFILRLGLGEEFSAPPHWDFILLLIFCDSHSCAQALCVLGSKLYALICFLEIVLLGFFFFEEGIEYYNQISSDFFLS